MSQRENAKVQQSVGGDNLNTMVLLGINSNEKCTIGNAILKEDHFKAASNTFVRVEGKVAGQNFCIISTPDLIQRPSCDPEANTMEEMKPSYTGQRMFLLVLQDYKLSKEETEMFTQLKERFGSKMVESTIVVLVTSEEKRSRQPYSQADENLKEVLDQCGKRICVHNKNRDTEDTELIPQVMEYWGEMQEKQAHESINLTYQPSGEENLYEEVDTIKLMKEVPQVSTVSEKNKGENIQSSGGDYKITVVLLGKKIHDKCLIGNTILGNRHFKSEKTTCEKAEENIAGQKFCIIITPDIFHKSNSDSQADIIEELKPSYPGARMFLLVLQEKKMSQKKLEMFFQLKEKFGNKMVESTIVVLVNSEEKRSGQPFDQADENLRRVLDECGKRICVHKMKQDIKDTELIKQMMEYWGKCRRSRLMNQATLPLVKREENIQPSGGDYKITVVLLGKNSHDKCLIGNTILEKNQFPIRKEKEMFTQLKEKFGKKMVENTIVLVNGEKKHSSMDSSKVTFNNDFYRQILDECGTRVL
ncbi:GTPase IMAP family member 8 [Xyrauchen texanus]|uniref:GTPase IMAP family member 8 n=1 Tax=Xyrauchen texanus TaxID=154827 RepID=UPI00224230EE|nr:GTPase IMAP family member 8 [Xyrauchen texanus]